MLCKFTHKLFSPGKESKEENFGRKTFSELVVGGKSGGRRQSSSPLKGAVTCLPARSTDTSGLGAPGHLTLGKKN
ncbi:hypothetical protein GE061_007126 [Apolygus lucorum]|uniref:Uncharacterized protein n=1 Tax=Apolygus lucorum TaxID=248454 RepID=A0A8S9WSL3_APOLU|nr:hypothetical protein GE061_007126 [Apolygus lucorum]